MFKLEGTLKVISETVQVTDKFSKRDFVLVDDSSMYPQEIAFQLAQDKCPILDGYMEGEKVEVSFNLKGRMWTSPQGEDKYFNTLEAWRIEKVGASAPAPRNKKIPSAPVQAEEEDDLPF